MPVQAGQGAPRGGGPQAGGTLAPCLCKAAKACTRLPQTRLGPAVPHGTSFPAPVPPGLGPGPGSDLLRPRSPGRG